MNFEKRDGVAILTLENGRLNIFTREQHERLYRALLRFLRDDDLKVAILTSAPGQSFSAGDDLKTVDEPFGDAPDWSELTTLMPRNKPIIAGVRGYCLGQGVAHLLRLTDIRYASPDALFGLPEIKYGMGGGGSISGLSQQVPSVIAMHMALTGEPISAKVAADCHLINGVVEDEALLSTCLEVAQKIAAHPLDAIKTELSPAVRATASSAYLAMSQLTDIWDRRD
ncbi:hypothetical protein ABENE_20455 [Asticcacaulis benevestitus DSM 16100 = ATCC BAA-896]|uniref:Enoyl-CoA hydratase n=1 Tax=Asticcacaulis benevestitus DSM 16100 = ATCC BAA-896 TaxID=1121022 RepID=V4P530_9CAUL|nr:hypothetical protein ABENE_20455 [Asticcacaulis benevestitus DSM 16100 = ATCC BAA-896]